MNYKWIEFPDDISITKKEQYEAIADWFLANISQPIAVVWALPDEDWIDDDSNPPRNCLLITEHVKTSDGGWTFGRNLASIILH